MHMNLLVSLQLYSFSIVSVCIWGSGLELPPALATPGPHGPPRDVPVRAHVPPQCWVLWDWCTRAGSVPPNNDNDDDNNNIIYHTVPGSHCMVVVWSPCSAVSCALKRFSSHCSNAYSKVFSLSESIGLSCSLVCSLPLCCWSPPALEGKAGWRKLFVAVLPEGTSTPAGKAWLWG